MTDNFSEPVADPAGAPASPTAHAEMVGRTPLWKRPPILIGGAVAALVVIAAAVIVPMVMSAGHSPFVDAVETCKLKSSDYVRLGDDGKTLTLDGGSLDGIDGLGIKDQGCINRELKVPEYVVTEMLSTRALDGVQKETFGDITARWTYHPDNGLDVIFTRK